MVGDVGGLLKVTLIYRHYIMNPPGAKVPEQLRLVFPVIVWIGEDQEDFCVLIEDASPDYFLKKGFQECLEVGEGLVSFLVAN